MFPVTISATSHAEEGFGNRGLASEAITVYQILSYIFFILKASLAMRQCSFSFHARVNR